MVKKSSFSRKTLILHVKIIMNGSRTCWNLTRFIINSIRQSRIVYNYTLWNYNNFRTTKEDMSARSFVQKAQRPRNVLFLIGYQYEHVFVNLTRQLLLNINFSIRHSRTNTQIIKNYIFINFIRLFLVFF